MIVRTLKGLVLVTLSVTSTENVYTVPERKFSYYPSLYGVNQSSQKAFHSSDILFAVNRFRPLSIHFTLTFLSRVLKVNI